MKSAKKLSRYSLMQESSTIDSITGEVYPDIFTAGYETFEFTTQPKRVILDPVELGKPFYITYKHYNNFFGDDILLDLNLIPHYKYLSGSKYFFIPSSLDFNIFIKAQAASSRMQGKF